MKKIIGNIISILLIIICSTVLSAAEQNEFTDSSEQVINPNLLDFTQSGHFETDYGSYIALEWWYLNGEATSLEGKNISFFFVVAHQESPAFTSENGIQLSHLLTFCNIFHEDGTSTFKYNDTYVSQLIVDHFVSFHTPYLYYVYPGGERSFYGTAYTGYFLNYQFDELNAELVFLPKGEKTVDQADQPLNFITYENSCGYLEGSVFINDTEYIVTNHDGYMDHMIPSSETFWTNDMHGWSWTEVTAEKYQAVIYAIRSPIDGYENYSYKQMTLLNKSNGKVIAEYSGDDVTITQTDWINESYYQMKRPGKVVYSASDLEVTVEAQNVVCFNSFVGDQSEFVDFMAYQPENAKIEYNGDMKRGSAFNEYLVSSWSVISVSQD